MRSLILFFLSFPFLCYGGYELSICTIFQNEAPYLKVWIDYHIGVGVEHFWLYNNNSSDEYLLVLDPYIKSGRVELFDWSSDGGDGGIVHFCYQVQIGAYNDALNRGRGVTKWLAIIDADEFIVPVASNSIVKVLRHSFSDAAGICINWQCYGTSNVEKIGINESFLEKLVYRLPTQHPKNLYFKSIVQPCYVQSCVDPHYCRYISNRYHVNTDKEQVGNISTTVLVDKLRINHYWARDKFFLNHVKIPRYQTWGGWGEGEERLAEEMNSEFDDCILKLIPSVTKKTKKLKMTSIHLTWLNRKSAILEPNEAMPDVYP